MRVMGARVKVIKVMSARELRVSAKGNTTVMIEGDEL